MTDRLKGSRLELLQVIENKNRAKRFVCEHVFPELTALCPTTGLPDFYTAGLVYEPDESLIELKSLKYYLMSYRDKGIHHEELANDILDDFIGTVNPRWVYLELQVSVRGGISTYVRRFWNRESGDDIELAIKGAGYLTKDELPKDMKR
ncbi:MAG: preQ(1) synthase [bacterium]